MPYNNYISRSDTSALIPEEVSAEILTTVAEMNPILSLARQLPRMSRAQKRLPILGTFATAYFVTGDTGLKQTTEQAWENKYIDAEELAAIVPIPEAVLDDADYDIWGQVRPEIERALSIAVTAAVMYGTNIPSTWTTNLGAAGLYAGANAASQVISIASYTDLYEAVLGETLAEDAGLWMLCEEDGYMVTGNIAAVLMKGKLRNVRDADGNPIFKTSMQTNTQYELEGTPIFFPTDGSVDSDTAYMMSGQFDQLVYAMRQDITYKVLTEAVLQDASGNIVFNLAQQDMVALRAVMRLGVALPNPPSRMNENDSTRFPFAFLTA